MYLHLTLVLTEHCSGRLDGLVLTFHEEYFVPNIWTWVFIVPLTLVGYCLPICIMLQTATALMWSGKPDRRFMTGMRQADWPALPIAFRASNILSSSRLLAASFKRSIRGCKEKWTFSHLIQSSMDVIYVAVFVSWIKKKSLDATLITAVISGLLFFQTM